MCHILPYTLSALLKCMGLQPAEDTSHTTTSANRDSCSALVEEVYVLGALFLMLHACGRADDQNVCLYASTDYSYHKGSFFVLDCICEHSAVLVKFFEKASHYQFWIFTGMLEGCMETNLNPPWADFLFSNVHAAYLYRHIGEGWCFTSVYHPLHYN